MKRGPDYYLHPDEYAMTLEQVGAALGIQPKVVGNYQVSAMRKLRKHPLALGAMVSLAREVARAREAKMGVEVRR